VRHRECGRLGELSGERRRIGCPGYSARRQNVAALLTAMEGTIAAQGYDADEPAGIRAAAADSEWPRVLTPSLGVVAVAFRHSRPRIVLPAASKILKTYNPSTGT